MALSPLQAALAGGISAPARASSFACISGWRATPGCTSEIAPERGVLFAVGLLIRLPAARARLWLRPDTAGCPGLIAAAEPVTQRKIMGQRDTIS
jgi:hypothetical protein